MRIRMSISVLVLLSVAACGVPSQQQPTAIDPKSVPFGLLQHRPDRPGPRIDGRMVRAVAYFVRDDAVVGTTRSLPADVASHRVSAVVTALTAGPTEKEQARGFSTAIPPTLQLEVSSVKDRQAVIEIAGEPSGVTATESPLAIAQIVLSVTSVPGIDQVRLTRHHQPLEAPRADGSLTSDPLTSADYQSLRSEATHSS